MNINNIKVGMHGCRILESEHSGDKSRGRCCFSVRCEEKELPGEWEWDCAEKTYVLRLGGSGQLDGLKLDREQLDRIGSPAFDSPTVHFQAFIIDIEPYLLGRMIDASVEFLFGELTSSSLF